MAIRPAMHEYWPSRWIRGTGHPQATRNELHHEVRSYVGVIVRQRDAQRGVLRGSTERTACLRTAGVRGSNPLTSTEGRRRSEARFAG